MRASLLIFADMATSFSAADIMEELQSKREEVGEFSSELETSFKKNGMDGIQRFVDQRLGAWKSVRVNVAVTGQSGSGKSLFINTFRDASHMTSGFLGPLSLLLSALLSPCVLPLPPEDVTCTCPPQRN